MDTNITWIQPLILLPGVALLVVSTSYRFGQAQDEVHHLLMYNDVRSPIALSHLKERLMLIRNALTGLYSSIALFALGSISGVVTLAKGENISSVVVVIFTGVGIAVMLLSVLALVRESMLSTEVLRDHLTHVGEPIDNDTRH